MSVLLEILLGLQRGELADGGRWRFGCAALPESPLAVLALAVLASLLGWLIARSYARQGELPRRSAGLLAGLRIATMLAVMGALLEPTVTVQHVQAERSTVLVLVDDTRSMSLTDCYDDPNRPAALAAALGVPPSELETLSRLETARRLLTAPDGPLEQLASHHRLAVLRFGAGESPGSPYAQPVAVVDGLPATQELAAGLAGLGAQGLETDPVRALREALDSPGVRGRALAGAVLVSDGRATTDLDAARLAGLREFLRQRSANVVGVCVGDRGPAPAVRVAALEIPSPAHVGSVLTARALLEGQAPPGPPPTVRLYRREPGESRWVDTGLSAPAGQSDGRSRSAVEIPLETGRAGTFLYKAVLEPAAPALAADGAAYARLRVSEARTRVLLIAGAGGWEFQFLRDFLLARADRYVATVWQQDADAPLNRPVSSAGAPKALPRTARELDQLFDVVLLIDPAPAPGAFDGQFARALGEFAAAHRGGVVYVASRQGTSADLAGQATGLEPLADMLPVVVRGPAPAAPEPPPGGTPAAWAVLPTPAGAEHPILRLHPNPARNKRDWCALPGIYWSQPVKRLKGAAVALAVTHDPARRTDDGRAAPMIALQTYGLGPVLYVGFDGTWRWRAARQGRCYRAFWSNVLDHLSSARSARRRVILSTAGESFAAGRAIGLTAEVYGPDGKPHQADRFTVWLSGLDGNARQAVELERVVGPQASPALPLYRGGVRVDPPGCYELSAGPDVPPEQVDGPLLTVAWPGHELARPHASPRTLAELAGAANVLNIERIGELPARIARTARTRITETTHGLWSTWLTPALLTTLLMSEWIIRKRHDLI